MEFKFDATQEYQLDAIEAATDLLEGQAYVGPQLHIPDGASFQVIANRLDLDEAKILSNLQEIQSERGIPPDPYLQLIEQTIDTVAGSTATRCPNFSIEMETA